MLIAITEDSLKYIGGRMVMGPEQCNCSSKVGASYYSHETTLDGHIDRIITFGSSNTV